MGMRLLQQVAVMAVIAGTCVQAQQLCAGEPASGYYTDCVPDSAALLPDRSVRNQLAMMRTAHLDAIEGIWSYPDEMMTVAVERFHSPDFASRIAYRIVMLESEDFNLLPGTVIGYIAPSADACKYELWLYSERHGAMLYTPVQFVATLKDEMLTFRRRTSVNVKVRVNFARFLPSLFRGVSVTPQIEREELPVGFRRIFPTPVGTQSYGNRLRYL